MAELMSKEDFLDLFYVMAMGQDKKFIEAVEQVVDDTPTVDAVEVVRCGKCKYFDTDWAYCGSDVHYCKKHKCARRESEFCSYGERKENK